MTSLIFLAIGAAASFNSFLQFGLGVRQLLLHKVAARQGAVCSATALIVTGPLIFVFFNYVLAPLSLGFMGMFLLYPVLALSCIVLNNFVFRKFGLKNENQAGMAVTAYDGLVIGNAFFVLRLTADLVSAFVFSTGAALGTMLSCLILNAVRERLETENVPMSLRGFPLMLIATGLLSLTATYLASLGFAAFGVKP